MRLSGRKGNFPNSRQRFEAFKGHPRRDYYQHRMPHDVARMSEVGLARKDMTQADLATKANKYESKISKLINSESNAKLGTIAQVLVALDIVPKIVDTAEWDALQEMRGSLFENRRASKDVDVVMWSEDHATIEPRAVKPRKTKKRAKSNR